MQCPSLFTVLFQGQPHPLSHEYQHQHQHQSSRYTLRSKKSHIELDQESRILGEFHVDRITENFLVPRKIPY